MIINRENCFDVGNKAMGVVLFLYYQMIDEGGFSHGQSVYINYDDFNAHEFIKVQVLELENESLDLNEKLLKQGAVISLLCIMHNSITEEDFVPSSNDEIIKLLREYGVSLMPEISEYLDCVVSTDEALDFDQYSRILSTIYEKYVKETFIQHATK